jgi:hypothetical protein
MGMIVIRSFFTKKTSINSSKHWEAVDHLKTEFMPDFYFDAFNHDNVPSENGETEMPEATVNNEKTETTPAPAPSDSGTHEDVDKW